MPDILLRKTLGTLRPVDAQGEETLAGIPNGVVVRAAVKRPRNIKHHRKYWALMTILLDNQDRYQTAEELSDAIKCAVGHCNVLTKADGYEIRIPKSIAFSKMDQLAFNAFYDRVVDLAVTRIIPGLPEGDLRREVEAMVGEREAA